MTSSEKDWGPGAQALRAPRFRQPPGLGGPGLGSLPEGSRRVPAGRSHPPLPGRLRRAKGRVASVAAPLPSQNAGRQRRFWLFLTADVGAIVRGLSSAETGSSRGQAQLVPRAGEDIQAERWQGRRGNQVGVHPPGAPQTWPRALECYGHVRTLTARLRCPRAQRQPRLSHSRL